MWKWGKKESEDDADDDGEEAAEPSAEERQRARERLGLGTKRPPDSEKPPAPEPDDKRE